GRSAVDPPRAPAPPLARDRRPRLGRRPRRGVRPARRLRHPGRGLRPLPQRRPVEPDVLHRPRRLAGGGRGRRGGGGALRHRRRPLPHAHRGVPVAHRRGPGRQPDARRLALGARVPPTPCAGAAQLPRHRREHRRGASRSRRQV
ncbi:MAG: hypothetical protein AVDCRST_MAG20-2828, partial [uncultured Acidimicrobiales bacterium]